METSKVPVILKEEDGKRASFFIGDVDKPAKVLGPNEEELDLEQMPVAPDGGYGWVIVFASFLSNLVVDGTVFSFGVILNPIHEASGGSIPISRIAWVGSLATGFYFLAGPVVSAVANRFGFRVVAICGALLGSGAVLASWAVCREETNDTCVSALFVLYGVIGGSGFGMIYVPAVIAVGFYFDNKRALATGIAICGSGIGTFLFPPVMNYMIENYEWQGALLFQSGIILTCIFFGMLYRPLKPKKVVGDKSRRKSLASSVGSGTPQGTPLLMRIKQAREMEKWDSVNSFVASNETLEDPKANSRIYVKTRKTSAHSLSGSVRAPQKRLSVPSMLGSDLLAPAPPPKGKSFVGLLPLPDVKEETAEEDGENHSRENSAPPSKKLDGNENSNHLTNRNNSTFTITKIGSSTLTVDEVSQSRVLRVASKVSLNKPLYRDDIFYHGSLLRLPQYANNVNKVMTSAEWSAAVTSIPKGVDPDAPEACCCSGGIMKKMLDVSLLLSPTFLLLSISGFFTMLGLFVPFIYLKGVAIEAVGLSAARATLLVSIIGIANTGGRVISGAIADRPEINVLFLNNASVTIIGLSTAFVPFLSSFNALVGFASVFGLSMACYASLRSILLVELLGLEKLTNAFGLTLLFQGIASILGSPLAGFLYETTGSYDIPFYVAGFFIVFSGLMCYPLNHVKRWEEAKNNPKPKEQLLL